LSGSIESGRYGVKIVREKMPIAVYQSTPIATHGPRSMD
jgi:hypothetical protein